MNETWEILFEDDDYDCQLNSQPSIEIPTSSASRRSFLQTGAVAVGAAVGFGAFPATTRRTEAGLPLFARFALDAGITWVVGKTLDHLYDWYVGEKPKVVVGRNQPTGNRLPFHDRHAGDERLAGTTIREQKTRSGIVVAKVDHLAFAVPTDRCCRRHGADTNDLNKQEIYTLMKYYNSCCHSRIPWPVSPRTKPTKANYCLVSSVLNQEYDASPRDWTLEYRREFASADRRVSKTGFGLASTERPDKKRLVFV